MARKMIDIDLPLMQSILEEEASHFRGAAIPYYQHCCNIYREKNNVVLNPQIIYLRVNQGKLNFNTCPTDYLQKFVDNINTVKGKNYSLVTDKDRGCLQLNDIRGNSMPLAELRAFLLGMMEAYGIPENFPKMTVTTTE